MSPHQEYVYLNDQLKLNAKTTTKIASTIPLPALSDAPSSPPSPSGCTPLAAVPLPDNETLCLCSNASLRCCCDRRRRRVHRYPPSPAKKSKPPLPRSRWWSCRLDRALPVAVAGDIALRRLAVVAAGLPWRYRRDLRPDTVGATPLAGCYRGGWD